MRSCQMLPDEAGVRAVPHNNISYLNWVHFGGSQLVILSR